MSVIRNQLTYRRLIGKLKSVAEEEEEEMELVEVKLRLPKQVIDFLKIFMTEDEISEFLYYKIIIAGLKDRLAIEAKDWVLRLADRYGLNKIFEEIPEQ
jgi:hypothetical protein